jgi:hypothetical protein
VKGLVVVVKIWVCLEGAYNGNKVCTRELIVLRDRGFNLGGMVKIQSNLV